MAYVKGVEFIDESGNPYGIKQIENKPRVVSTPYGYAISENGLANHTSLFKFGSNPDVGTSEETIWQHGGLYDWTSVDAAAGVVKVSSSSANDTSAGTGARTCTIYGLDTSGNVESETITLNGQTAVNSVNSYSRVNRIIVNTAGSSNANVGVIYVGTGTVTAGVPAVVWSTVAIGKNQTLQSIWTVPNDYTLYITGFYASTNSNKGEILNIYIKPVGELFQIKANAYLFSNAISYHFDLPLKISAMTDIDCRAIGALAGAGVQFSFEGWYEYDPAI